MARPRKTASIPQLSAGQATYVLERLVADRRISANDVSRYVSEMRQEIDHLEERLAALRQANGGEGRAARAPRGRAGRPGRRITAEQRASRQIQGRYLGLIRQIPASRRGPFQKIAREKGREAAIKELAAALSK